MKKQITIKALLKKESSTGLQDTISERGRQRGSGAHATPMSFMAQNLYNDGDNDNDDLSECGLTGTFDPSKPVFLTDVYTQPEHWVLGNNRPIERLQTVLPEYI